MKKQIYLYDGSFFSLLNLIKILLSNHIVPHNIVPNTYQPSLFEETINLSIPQNPDIVTEFIKSAGLQVFNTIHLVYLSNDENKEIIIYYFFVRSLHYHNQIFYMRNLKSVASALTIAKYVSHECHKLKGFLRFKELENHVLYAEMSPDNNLIFLLSKHFSKRLKNERWIIKDVKRQLLSIYDTHNFYLIPAESLHFDATLSQEENNLEKLWQNFFKTIAIQERQNPRCQMNFMPKKYWKYLIEMSDIYEENHN